MPLPAFLRRIPRPVLPHSALNLLISSWVMLALNHGFWSRLMAQFPGSPGRVVIFGIGVWALTLMTLELFGPGRLQKPVAAILIMVAAAASYYERNFGVLIDREMVRNIFETTYTESRHLVTLRMGVAIFLTGVVPAALVFWPKVRRVGLVHQLWRWPTGVALSFALMVGALFSHYKDYSAMLRERHDLMGAYQPGASLTAGIRFAREQWKTADPVAAPWGRDAKPGTALASADKPVLLVVFVGETVRAQNFGLNGYARDTTPELAKRDVIAFTDATSCGTSTAVSVPCMFSGLGQAGYSREAALGRENLMDILGQAGIRPLWADNNTGDQNVAKRTGWSRIDATLAPEACKVECTDEALLPVIRDTLAGIDRDTVLVLHMIGSHGPAYFLRSAPERAGFSPACETAQFADCSTEEIVNAYDNSIRETDHVLASTIDMLADAQNVIPAMVYMSDHGESLGENGLYLHAAPSFMAPAEQVKVPFILWLDPRFTAVMGLDRSCLAYEAAKPVSHDNFFHTVLGLMDVSTSVRNPGLDLTAPCRKDVIM
ncbi:phosphoethanolamine transferase [Pseudogemmobacter bohemicus]|uniref:phosphoethanolamine transferase n=1 Tax=Pseudogemmobacter bohemicus TaxID=2250708 RepID=UPI0018E59494|nr:sulfatase-like hydrolase/transferase [Pseudogemmobacter bohemicus]